MRPLIIWFLLLVSSLAAPNGYKLVLFEDFDGPDLNINLWNIETGKRHEAINCFDAIEQVDGLLKIRPFTRVGQHYSGIINSRNNFEFNKGYVEIRARFGPQAGCWGALWLYADNVGLDEENHKINGLEVDLIENRRFDFNGKDISNYANQGFHYNGYGRYHKCIGTDTGDVGLADGKFHIIGLLWTDEGFEFFVDGKKTWENSINTDARLFLVFSVELGYFDGWSSAPPAELSGNPVIEIDWVKVYQRR